MSDERGVYRKFTVTRTDGSDAFGGKHYGCNYFVLDLSHDKYAKAALQAYAKSCAKERPELARDLRKLARAPMKQTQRLVPDRNMTMQNMMRDTTRYIPAAIAAPCHRCELDRDGFGFDGMLAPHTCKKRKTTAKKPRRKGKR